MKTVFMDTVGLLALYERRDQWHAVTSTAMTLLQGEGTRLVTSTAVMLELGNAAARKPYREDVEQVRAELKATDCLLVPTESDEDQAWRDYRAGVAGDASIVDLLSFVLMRRLGRH
jgi:uncharacterized protein